jgi:hypothetical protein
MGASRFGLVVSVGFIMMACGGGGGGEAKSAADQKGGDAAGGEWTLPERETWDAYQKEAKEWADATNEKCGTKLTGSWNAESFRGHMPDKDRWSRQACQKGFETLQEICGQGDMQKAAVAKKFGSGSVECKWSATKGGGLEISDGKLILVMDSEGGFGGPDSNSVIIDAVKAKL